MLPVLVCTLIIQEVCQILKEPIFEYGEYVAFVWYDDGLNCLRWQLGVVDGTNNGEVLVSFMEMSGMKFLRMEF